MNTITRWDPFKELDELQSRLSTLFGRAPVRDGVLQVHLPKSEKARPKNIEVKIA
jgi:hypothetical protein